MARHLASLGARTVTIRSVCPNLTTAEVGRVYRDANDGKASPSGQTPSDMDWYFKSPRVHKVADLFFALYLSARESDGLEDPGQVKVRMLHWFCSAYEATQHMTRGLYHLDKKDYEPILDVERALFLIKMHEAHCRPSSESKTPPFFFLRCTSCGTMTLAPVHKLRPQCSICQENHRRGRSPKHHTIGRNAEFTG